MNWRNSLSLHVCLLALTTIVSFARSTTITHRYLIPEPHLIELPDGHQLMDFGKSYQLGKIGEPSLPHIPVQLLLPPGHIAHSIRIQFKNRIKFKDNVRLAPKQYPRNEALSGHVQIQKHHIYSRNNIYTAPASKIETHYFYGHSIALSYFCPVEYIPLDGSIHYYSEAEVVVETGPDPDAAASLHSFRLTPTAQFQLSKIVENYDQIRSLYNANLFEPVYDYLIITIEQFVSEYESLMIFYNQRGIRTRIESVENIYKTTASGDEQEKIRNYIIRETSVNGISCVLLAGDADAFDATQLQIPVRNFYCEVISGGQPVYGDIPSDLYYSALNGNWNTDGDDKWGEPDEDDLLPEIAVGRICADNPDEIAAHLNKIFAYQSTPVVSDARRMLMAGEKMWSNPLTYGADFLDLLIGDHNANGYSTVGMPNDLAYIYLYEKTSGTWNDDDILERINSGCNIIHHAGHSSATSNMNLSNSHITNANFSDCDGVKHLNPVVYSQGCLSAAFDRQTYHGQDCIGEIMLEIENFASAYIGNSRYGWFNEGQTEGPSLHLQREFINAVYGDAIYTLGAAHAVSRIRTAPFVTAPNQWEPGALRWCFYGCNVLGDPQMALWTNTINTFTNVNFPSEIETFPTTLEINTGTPNSQVCLSADGNLISSGIADEFGTIRLSLDSPPPSPTMQITITALNYLPYTATITSSVTDVTLRNSNINEFNLNKNYPNPFNHHTTIQFCTSKKGLIRLEIYNVMGQKIKTLLLEEVEPGAHQMQWDARDEAGDIVSNGIYFIRLNSPERTRIRSCLLLK